MPESGQEVSQYQHILKIISNGLGNATSVTLADWHCKRCHCKRLALYLNTTYHLQYAFWLNCQSGISTWRYVLMCCVLAVWNFILWGVSYGIHRRRDLEETWAGKVAARAQGAVGRCKPGQDQVRQVFHVAIFLGSFNGPPQIYYLFYHIKRRVWRWGNSGMAVRGLHEDLLQPWEGRCVADLRRRVGVCAQVQGMWFNGDPSRLVLGRLIRGVLWCITYTIDSLSSEH